MKGYRTEEILRQHICVFYEPRDVELGKPEQALQEAAKFGRAEDEGWRVRKDGSRFWANVIITAVKDEAGRLRGFGKMIRDITERKATEEKLRRSEAYLAEAQKLAHTSSWAWNLATGELFWSEEHFRIFGLNSKTAKRLTNCFFQMIHPQTG